jgi:hypothetical protein
LNECRRWSICKLNHISPPSQLADTSENNWTALSIGRGYDTLFTAYLSALLSKPFQPTQAEDGRGPLSIYTGSLVQIMPLLLSLFVQKYAAKFSLDEKIVKSKRQCTLIKIIPAGYLLHKPDRQCYKKTSLNTVPQKQRWQLT